MSRDWSDERDAPAPNAWLKDFRPYVGGEGALNGRDRVIKLSSNENPLGPSPRAIDAFRRAADSLHVYPDGGSARLRGAIASVHALEPDRIVCGAGSDELIGLFCQAFCAPGDEVVHTTHGFSMYRIRARAVGATPVPAAEDDALRADPQTIISAISPRTKLVFLANPNNPTGTYLPREALTALLDAIPQRVLVVIDGAYAEYMRTVDYEPGFALVDAYPNVATTRSFSKVYGLAAMRLGWAYCRSDVADALNAVRGPFNVSSPALAAGEAAIQDVDYTDACAIQNEVWRDWLTKEMRAAGLRLTESFANFVLPYFGERGPTSAASADAYLRSRGIIARRMENDGLPGHLRITVGASGDNVAVASAIGAFLAESAD